MKHSTLGGDAAYHLTARWFEDHLVHYPLGSFFAEQGVNPRVGRQSDFPPSAFTTVSLDRSV